MLTCCRFALPVFVFVLVFVFAFVFVFVVYGDLQKLCWIYFWMCRNIDRVELIVNDATAEELSYIRLYIGLDMPGGQLKLVCL